MDAFRLDVSPWISPLNVKNHVCVYVCVFFIDLFLEGPLYQGEHGTVYLSNMSKIQFMHQKHKILTGSQCLHCYSYHYHGRAYSPTLLSLPCCSWVWKPLAAFQSCQGKSGSPWHCDQNSSRMGPSPLQFILHSTQSPTLCWEVEFTRSPQYPITL